MFQKVFLINLVNMTMIFLHIDKLIQILIALPVITELANSNFPHYSV